MTEIACPPLGARVGERAIEPPLRGHARLVEHDEAHVDVEIRGVRFCFRRRDQRGGPRWEGGCAIVIEAGIELDERWLTRARALAVNIASEHLGGGVPRAEPEPVRCPECQALLVAPLLAWDVAEVVRVLCDGGAHRVEWDDGRAVLVTGPGESHLLQAPDPV